MDDGWWGRRGVAFILLESARNFSTPRKAPRVTYVFVMCLSRVRFTRRVLFKLLKGIRTESNDQGWEVATKQFNRCITMTGNYGRTKQTLE